MGSNLTKRRLNLSGKTFKFSRHSGVNLKNQPLVVLFYKRILRVLFWYRRDLRIDFDQALVRGMKDALWLDEGFLF